MKRLIFFALLLTACAAPAIEPAANSEATRPQTTLRLVISFWDDSDIETAVVSSVWVDDQLLCEEVTTCDLEFTKPAAADASIPLRIVADGYKELSADMTDTLDQSGTLVLNVTLIPLGDER